MPQIQQRVDSTVWQHVKLSVQIRPWDTLACCWDVKLPTNKQTCRRSPYLHHGYKDTPFLASLTFSSTSQSPPSKSASYSLTHFSPGSYASTISLCPSNFQVLVSWSGWFSKRLIFSAFVYGFKWNFLKKKSLKNILCSYLIVIFKTWQMRRAKLPGIRPHPPQSPARPVRWKPKLLF